MYKRQFPALRVWEAVMQRIARRAGVVSVSYTHLTLPTKLEV
ncbi:hypothetical protein JMUB7547_28760 [Staphylococcus aureus]